jgi:hypothetical protein
MFSPGIYMVAPINTSPFCSSVMVPLMVYLLWPFTEKARSRIMMESKCLELFLLFFHHSNNISGSAAFKKKAVECPVFCGDRGLIRRRE